MKIKTLIPFTAKDGDDFISPRKGEILDVSDEAGASLIADGYAEAYTLITPEGKISITENGTGVDVAQYAEADVAVPNPNTVVTVTGTAANPWGDMTTAEIKDLFDAIEAGNATAIIETEAATIHVSASSTTDIPSTKSVFLVNLAAYVSGASTSPSIAQCYLFAYNRQTGAIVEARMASAQNGGAGIIVDLSYGTSEIPSTLTVIYHPLPN